MLLGTFSNLTFCGVQGEKSGSWGEPGGEVTHPDSSRGKQRAARSLFHPEGKGSRHVWTREPQDQEKCGKVFHFHLER